MEGGGMKYPVYPKYKESGVAWLGVVPEHWEAVSLKWVSQRYAGGTPDKSNDAYWEEGDIPWLNSGSVNDGYIIEPSAFITKEGFANSSAKWIPEKSLVMALAGQGKTKGMVAQLGIRTTCNQSMAAIIPEPNVYPRYLYWWLVSNYQNIRNMAGGEQRDGLNLVMIGSIPCPLLPDKEQTAIADFLDRGKLGGRYLLSQQIVY
jgi:type I restriction enzyme S subunit